MVSGVRYNRNMSRGDKVTLDFMLTFASDALVRAEAGLSVAYAVDLQLTDVFLEVCLRIECGPLVPKLPLFSEFSIALIGRPRLDFTLHCGVAPLSSVPGLMALLRHIIVGSVLGPLICWPNRVVVPVTQMSKEEVLQEARPRSAGLLRIRVRRVVGLPTQRLFGNAGHYCTVSLEPGDDTCEHHTAVVAGMRDPVWEMSCECLVETAHSCVLFTVRQQCVVGTDAIMGMAHIDVGKLNANAPTSCCLSLDCNGRAVGNLFVDVDWKPFSLHISSIVRHAERWSVGVLYVLVNQCRHGYGLDSGVPGDAYIALDTGGLVEKTPIVAGPHPVYNATFRFLVQDVEQQTLRVRAVHVAAGTGTETVVGSVECRVADVVLHGELAGTWRLDPASKCELDVMLHFRPVSSSTFVREHGKAIVRV